MNASYSMDYLFLLMRLLTYRQLDQARQGTWCSHYVFELIAANMVSTTYNTSFVIFRFSSVLSFFIIVVVFKLSQRNYNISPSVIVSRRRGGTRGSQGFQPDTQCREYMCLTRRYCQDRAGRKFIHISKASQADYLVGRYDEKINPDYPNAACNCTCRWIGHPG